MAFGHFLLGSHNLMVTALGSCVKRHCAFKIPGPTVQRLAAEYCYEVRFFMMVVKDGMCDDLVFIIKSVRPVANRRQTGVC